ncbi:hypothetical protein DL238_15040 [Alteriqipengyuania lutimaris]|uniref:Uncharacterized protein n=2 Tax=Alteriqipengyuania lutimaris TaxID=1538146 RepID=A0A395LKM4_9SPHN|nr:hypothetical protein DL238_15040 [Alteriqipengyuania lutimaris]
MRSCRQRAELSIAQVAAKISANGEHRYTARNLRALEQDQPGDYAQLIDTLHAHQPFAFDRAILLGRMASTADPAFDDLPTRIAA